MWNWGIKHHVRIVERDIHTVYKQWSFLIQKWKVEMRFQCLVHLRTVMTDSPEPSLLIYAHSMDEGSDQNVDYNTVLLLVVFEHIR